MIKLHRHHTFSELLSNKIINYYVLVYYSVFMSYWLFEIKQKVLRFHDDFYNANVLTVLDHVICRLVRANTCIV